MKKSTKTTKVTKVTNHEIAAMPLEKLIPKAMKKTAKKEKELAAMNAGLNRLKEVQSKTKPGTRKHDDISLAIATIKEHEEKRIRTGNGKPIAEMNVAELKAKAAKDVQPEIEKMKNKAKNIPEFKPKSKKIPLGAKSLIEKGEQELTKAETEKPAKGKRGKRESSKPTQITDIKSHVEYKLESVVYTIDRLKADYFVEANENPFNGWRDGLTFEIPIPKSKKTDKKFGIRVPNYYVRCVPEKEKYSCKFAIREIEGIKKFFIYDLKKAD